MQNSTENQGKIPLRSMNHLKLMKQRAFGGNIWEKQKSYNKDATWLDQIETENIEVNYQVWPQITLKETKSAIKKASNWKSPGKDGIANFWIKNLPSLHQDLTNAYNDCICNPETCPDWLTIGITYLLPKTEDTKNPKKLSSNHMSPYNL